MGLDRSNRKAAARRGVALSMLGRHEEARALQEETLALWRRVLPEGHPDIATGMGNLAATLFHLVQGGLQNSTFNPNSNPSLNPNLKPKP